MSDTDAAKGLYGKYKVERVDGSGAAGGKHEHCRYFVLDLEHDKHAEAAIQAYARSCRSEYPLLADDLDAIFPTEEMKRAAADAQHRDLDWIFSQGEGLLKSVPGASMQALAECLGVSLWGPRGEGYEYYARAMGLGRIVAPFIVAKDKAGWLEYCRKIKGEAAAE